MTVRSKFECMAIFCNVTYDLLVILAYLGPATGGAC